jgi:SAM-dependent methyltransferase
MEVDMSKEFWEKYAFDYAINGFDINESGTHKYIIESLNKYCDNAQRVLDYGCGDGSLIKKIEANLEFSIFDISKQMIELAKHNLFSLQNLKVYYDNNLIPKDYYDCAILSMVLICVPQIEEIVNIAQTLKRVLKNSGYLIVANPHPCFRDEEFSSYYTEYSIGKNYCYFNEGDKHKIFLRNTNLEFYDYNWSISKIVNIFLNIGFELVEMRELRDVNGSAYYNVSSSPIIMYILKLKL